MLREYQDDAVKQTGRLYLHHKNVMLVMPTGSGKTRCGCAIAIRSSNKGNLVNIFVHRIELMDQFYATLKILGHEAELCHAGNKDINWQAPIMICMVETYHRRGGDSKRNASFIIVDEAHRGEFNKIIESFNGKVLGLTATPIAASKDKPLSKIYDACLNPVKPSWLIENGYLCEPMYYAPKFDSSQLKIKAGEFTEESQYRAFMKPVLYKGALKQYKALGAMRKAICYNCSVEHSKAMHKEFQANGIKSWHVDGTTPKDERKQIFAEFAAYQNGGVLHNVGVATTGTDIPTVEVIILNRATTQLSSYHQMVGRGSRPIPELKSKFLIIDMGGNTPRFKEAGVYGADVDWQFLFNNPEGKYDGKKPREMNKSCPKCAKTINIRLTQCPCCQYKFTKEEALKSVELTRDLSLMRDILKEYAPKQFHKPVPEMNYQELVAWGKYMGYSSGWAGIQMGYRKRKQQNEQLLLLPRKSR